MKLILDRQRKTTGPARPTSAGPRLLTKLLTPRPGHDTFSLADAGKVERLPTAADVAAERVAETVAKATNPDTLIEQELKLKERLEAVRAIRADARAATSPSDFQERVQARAKKAERLHFLNMSAAMGTTRPIEVAAVEHYSFFAEARIPPGDAKLRGSIMMVIATGGLQAHPKFGTAEFCGPLEGIGNIHSDVFGLIVTSHAVTLNDEVVRLGGIAGAHSALIYVPLSPDRLNSLDQVLRDKPGEENVVLTCMPIRVRRASVYETTDVVISGSFASAGMELYKMRVSPEHGMGSSVTGNWSEWALSTAYALYDEQGPLVHDFGKGAFNRLPSTVQVGASATNPKTESTSNVNIYGCHVARGGRPAYQIQVRFTLNHLRRKLKIHGHRLLVPAAARGRIVRDLERELRHELVGGPPKPLQNLKLVEDHHSAEGRAALEAGGVLLTVETEISAQTEFLQLVILPAVPPPPTPAAE